MDLPSYRWRFVHLAALWGYGVSQPVFSMLKGNPELFYLRGTTKTDAFVFAMLLVVVPPLVVVAVEALSGVVARALSDAFHVVAVWMFAVLAVLQLTRLLDVNRGAALLFPLIPALLVAFLYLEVKPFRSFLALSVVLPVVGLVGFVASVPDTTAGARIADVRIAHPVPVVLVIFDEFPVSSLMRPDGSIDVVRYPNFARLARQGTWYRHATSVDEATTRAVPAILTGLAPKHGELPTLEDHPDNLFTLLGGDFRIHASEHATRLCPKQLCPGAYAVRPAGTQVRALFRDVANLYMRRVVPRSVRGWRRLENTFDPEFVHFLGAMPSLTSRQLDVVHLSLPHAPWHTLPSGRQYQDPAGVDGVEDDAIFNDWGKDSWLIDQSLQAHLLQVGYADRLLGRLIHRLQTESLYDRALVIVAADHGAGFRAGGSRRAVRADNLPDIAGVPLLVKYPKQRRGGIDDRDAKTIDIVPTIADVLGVRIPWHVDGVSLRGARVSRPVSVSKGDGDPVVGKLSAVEAGVLARARRNASLFGVGADSMYRIGPYPQLLGTSPASNVAPGPEGDDARLDDAAPFVDVRLSSGFVPERIAGGISRDVEAGTPLAVAVNGRVRAMTRSYEVDGQGRFEALVPETSFHDGRNAVEIYSVSRSSGAFRLRPLGGTPAPAGAQVAAAAASTRSSAGQERP
jgi:hypothetical protein